MTELATLLAGAAAGRFPPADGRTDILPAPGPETAVCLAFTAHGAVATDVDPDEVAERLASHRDPFAASLAPEFLVWLGRRTGWRIGVTDLLLVAQATGENVVTDLVDAGGDDHPRLARARARRRDVRAYADADRRAVLAVGRGVAGRWEVALELDESLRGRGVGRRLLRTALGLVDAGEPVFAQVSPGNARSVRAFLAAGFVPLGAEVLLHP